MSKYSKIVTLIVGGCLITAIGFTLFNHTNAEEESQRYQQHVEYMEDGADPTLGVTEFADGDYSVDESFETHLPIVVIDLEGNEIPDAYTYDHDEERFVLEDGVDPYVTGSISIINSDDHDNTLGDDAETVSKMRIKYRGNSSLDYAKHQYKIELVDEDGNSKDEDILGMGEESDWILNISMLDQTLLRNYMAYNICGQFMDYVPDVQYCEVVIKDGDSYEYEGVYLMMESVKQGNDRVDIKDSKDNSSITSYLVRRDRYDEEDIMLETYATMNDLSYGWLALRYPNGDDATDSIIDYVTDDISKIEKVIYSDDEETFMSYGEYIDEDSFVDYFLINEFLTNYDAGNNSTYYYKDQGGKLYIGPIWDYDNDLDNMGGYLLDPEIISFEGNAWFDKLIQSEDFDKKLISRYKELRETYFSDEYFCNYADDVLAFLGNAQKRDWSRWSDEYTSYEFSLIEDSDGVVIDRNYDDYNSYFQRMKDVFVEHASYIYPNLQELLEECRYKDAYRINYGLGLGFVLVLLIAIVVARRKAAR